MLFIESRILDHRVDSATRILLLEKLQEKGRAPLIRSTRLSCYEQALLGSNRIREMERAIGDWTEAENAVPYVRGDVFCLEDHVLYLIFGEAGGEQATALRAGIIYGARTAEPFRKLDVFCREVRESLLALRGEAEASAEGGVLDLTEWR
ncbi:MAG TPA: hypothetical protein VD966_13340, partial [Pyrinomonadaceae bacterium]|nr:hypothetical protein [Pyrinomonadaceae bacterium]